MAYQFPPELGKRVRALMSTGEYESEDQLLSDAVGMVERRLADIASIDRGLDDIDAGRFRSADEADAEFEKKHNITPG